jgi:S1-C subfamily serine protease
MISYIGQFKREKVNSTIREKLKKQKTIYTLMLLGFPLLFLLFDYGYINSPEEISGDRMATCKLTTDTGIGTAFLVSKNGLLLTARHCVDDVGEGETVTLDFDKVKKPGYDNLKATVVYLPQDKKDDFAILKLVNEIDITPLNVSGMIEDPSLYNPDIKVIGYPAIVKTQSIDNGNSVINYDFEEDSSLFIIDEIFKGYSGGPVIDIKTGEVIGIVSWKIVESDDEFWNSFLGMSFCEKVQQVFEDPNTSHINW